MTKTLTFAQYVPLAIITEAAPMTVACNLTGKSEGELDTLSLTAIARIRLLHASMGCATEAGELLDQLEASKRRVPISAVTKKRGKRQKIDRENIFEEIGDLFWYLAVFRDAYAPAFEDCPELPETESWAVPDKFKPRKPGRLFRTVAQRTLSFLDVAKKIIFYNRKTTNEDFLRAYYQVEQSILEVCWSFGIDPGQALYANIEKLKSRFEGKFSDAAANQRDLAAEMKALGFTDIDETLTAEKGA